jgi:hypothetical protein
LDIGVPGSLTFGLGLELTPLALVLPILWIGTGTTVSSGPPSLQMLDHGASASTIIYDDAI